MAHKIENDAAQNHKIV